MNETYGVLGSILFTLAVLHTFSIKWFQHLARKYPEGSVLENLFHLLGEVEIVFGIWAGILLLLLTAIASQHETLYFLESLNFTEPVFVFVIMTMASTKPVISLATGCIRWISRTLPVPKGMQFYFATLVLGPIFGSFITEPAAMTVTALILKKHFFDHRPSQKFLYTSLAVLFVNISIGGVLTHFAAPPVLMVSSIWSWDSAHMFDHFGWKATIATLANAGLASWLLRSELSSLKPETTKERSAPVWISVSHILFLAITVFYAHHLVVFVGVFLFFLGFTAITKEYQQELKIRDALLVGFFLGGLVVLGAFQSWWLKPLLNSLSTFPLFAGATILTGFVDNAALTYLGAQVHGISEDMKYALVAGAVTGGGLTVIANAPNPAGFSILGSSFGKEGISPLKLFVYAVIPTAIAALAFWCL